MLVKIVKAYGQLRQWHTAGKILVFESDDWGSVRMPSVGAFKKLSGIYPAIVKDHYSHFDTLASADDLDELYAVLEKYTDKANRHPVITANAIMTNPDFKKIKASGFNEYHYEPFYQTILSLPGGEQTLKRWKYGMDKKMFIPQFHGREHLIVPVWMYELQAGNEKLRQAFDEGVYSVPLTSGVYAKRRNLQAALDYCNVPGIDAWHRQFVTEGTQIFKGYFGFASKSFIATAYIWNRAIEQVLRDNGVQYIQGLPVQYEPKKGQTKYSKRFHFTGQKNRLGQTYLVRNAFFEPSSNPGFDWLGDCLRRIEKAFIAKSPAIVGVHRVNFIGSLVPANREKNLAMFDKLLSAVVKKWPDVEFMSSDELGDTIHNKLKR